MQNNLELKNEDELMIYKESQFFPQHTVSVGGAVRSPGVYPRHDSMTVADLVVLAGGLLEEASLTDWELARLDTTKIGTLTTIKRFGTLPNYWDDKANESMLLQDFDHLSVASNPKFNLQRVVNVTGYVLYPGSYALQREGEKLSSIIKRAGGLRPDSYLEGATLVRKWHQAGLVPIDFKKALSDTESVENVSLMADDSVNISFKQEIVLVRGEVFVPAAVVYQKGAGLNYYLQQAGGATDSADVDRTYVSLPNGRKWEKSWFLLPDPDILGGSYIFVPRKVEKEDKTLPILRDWATIWVSLATMVVAIVQLTK
jgi:protein involved in polysaccharide export with SLBB domain